MADLTDTRLKEMEEEMNRFEEEIQSSEAEVKMPLSAPVQANSQSGSSMRYATGVQPSHPPVGFHPPPMFIPPQLKNRTMPPPPRASMHPMAPMPGGFPVSIRTFAPPVFNARSQIPMFGPQSPQVLSKHPDVSAGPKSISTSAAIISAPKIVYSAPPVKNQPFIPEGYPAKTEEKPLSPPVMVTVASPPPKETEKKVSKASSSKSKDVNKSSTGIPLLSDAKKDKKDKKKKYLRMAAGTIWEDPSLTEWDPDDFRLFCGDLGNEVTDDVLNRVFSKYPSFQKARVIRDKRTNKTKGYGFASFKDPGDFMKAMRELNGKYVGNRPIKLRKSCWQDRQVENVKKKEREKKKLGFR